MLRVVVVAVVEADGTQLRRCVLTELGERLQFEDWRRVVVLSQRLLHIVAWRIR